MTYTNEEWAAQAQSSQAWADERRANVEHDRRFRTFLRLAVAAVIVAAFIIMLVAAQSAKASVKTCGDVTRGHHTAYVVKTSGTCTNGREMVARYIRHTHKGHAGQARTFRHAGRSVRCSWKTPACIYYAGGNVMRVVRWKWTVPYDTGLASWYDGGGTASGNHYTYGFASLFLAHGTRVEFCHNGCQVGVNDDRGPYVAGRLFDLRPNLKNAIGCGDLCWVRWRVVR